jgi:hypothetical protein
MAESQTFINNAQTILDANTNVTDVIGRRSAPYAASAVLDYELPWARAFRLGLTAVWTPDYNLATLNFVTYRGGASCPVGIYAIYNRKIFRQDVSFRAGVSRIYDIIQGGSTYYKSGANSLDATGKPNYIYRYTEPVTSNFSVDVRF